MYICIYICTYIYIYIICIQKHIVFSLCPQPALRLDRLGCGHESARGAVACAQAMVNEVGEENVHPVTKKVASMKAHNANRDLFRFISLPVDTSWVKCPVYSSPGSDEIIETLLPMYDPHELLEYLWSSGKMAVDTTTIEPFILSQQLDLWFKHLREDPPRFYFDLNV